MLWTRGAHAETEAVATPPVTTIKAQQSDEHVGDAEGQRKVANTSREGGDSSISHADDSAPAISLDSRHDVDVSDDKVNTLSLEEQVESENSSLGKRIAAASADVNTNPIEAQKEAENYKKSHVQVGRFDVAIEQPVGSVRRGTDADGKEWGSEMHHTYGYIRGTESVDGDHINVFISADIDGWNGRKAFVVDQYAFTDGVAKNDLPSDAYKCTTFPLKKKFFLYHASVKISRFFTKFAQSIS